MAVHRGRSSYGGGSGGGMDLRITGAEDLERLAKRFRQYGEQGKKLRSELRKDINKATKPAKTLAKANARRTLPTRGGLASLVARSRFSTKTRMTGSRVGVKVEAKRNGTASSLRQIDAGQVRHPVFGNRRRWVSQSVTPGWFTNAMQVASIKIRADIAELVRSVARKLENF